jgi:hypothetical protein
MSIPAFLTEDMDASTQTATVQIAIQEQARTSTGPAWVDIPPIILVPVLISRGGGFSVTLPLKKGNEGLLIFCDACIDNWWQNGTANSQAPTAPVVDGAAPPPSGSQRQNEVRRHHVHDCGFYPTSISQPNVLEDYSTSSLQIRSDDGVTVIDVAENGVTVTAESLMATVTDAVVSASGSAQITAGTLVQVTAPEIILGSGGTPLALVNDTWYQWWLTNIFPFLQGLGYVGPAAPSGAETTVLKAE